jgi:ribosomal protein S18 acetylase RimI-like enzyme
MRTPCIIREITPEEFPLVWPIFQEVIGSGDTFALDPSTTFEAARRYWVTSPARAFAAFENGEVVGSSMVRPFQPGHGDHVANAGYMVASAHRRKGIARQLCMHSLEIARAAGFSAMVFGFVVASNEGAVRLWRECGFDVVGRVPKAFRHSKLGMVDTLVMHRFL